ncbi:hypothetical protein Dimus_038442 [Dionaea muscipula]
MNLKCEYNMTDACFDEINSLMKELMVKPNTLPSGFYQTKKVLGGLGLEEQKIDCCVNECMLYWKADEDLQMCKFCNEPRFKQRRSGARKFKDVPQRRISYLPLTSRLQRLYYSDERLMT